MSLRRFGRLALALVFVAAGCTKSVSTAPSPDKLVFATFDSATATIPLPNDLALQAAPTLTQPVQQAQKLLLESFINGGGFPSDQEVPVTVPLKALKRNATTGAYEADVPPSVDASTVTTSTVTVLKVDGAVTVIPVEAGPATAGLLTIRKAPDASGSRRWAPGRYVVAVRGGKDGVKTSDGIALAPDQAISLVIPNKDLSKPENQPPVPLSAQQVQQLESLRAALWNPIDWGKDSGTGLWGPSVSATNPPDHQPVKAAFAAVDTSFPHQETASIATFEIGAAPGVQPLADTGSGQIALPSDFLLDGTKPVPNDPGRFYVRNVPAFGAAAAGLATLDGFSTTGMLLQPLNGAVQASTINANTVLLFELPSGAGNPRRMRDVAGAVQAGQLGTAEYLTQPPVLNRTVENTAVTTAIGLQPAVAVPVPNVGIVYTPPLKEHARYLVVVTKGVKDLSNNPIQRSTLGNILWGFPSDVPVAAGGHSLLSGVSDADATALQALRTGLNPVLDALPALTGNAVTRDDVVMAYTVSTQSVTGVSVSLSAALYDPTITASFTSPSASPLALTDVGLPPTAAALFPHVKGFLKGTVISLDAINPANGALNPDKTKWAPAQLPVLVAVPKLADTCTAQAPCPVPVVIWHHGINGGRLQMLGTADALAAKGFVVVATDAPYHGDRAFCAKNSDCSADGTATGADGVCTADPNKAGQGDSVPPGTCTTGSLRPGSNLTTVASGQYFISGNFFRIRDAIRQDVLDQAALVLAVARPPSPFPQPEGNALTAALLQQGVVVNPTQVYFEGQSLGGIIGAQILATNPRFARGALNVPGGTLTDIFYNAPAFQQQFAALLLSLGVDVTKVSTDPNVAAKYLQLNTLAKWILDPADPINYAQYAGGGLASPLTPASFGPTVHDSRALFGQLAKCDQVVPNATTVVNQVPLPYGDELLHLAGVRETGTTLYSTSSGDGCVSHGILLDTFNALASQPVIGGPVRDDAATFLLDQTYPAPSVVLTAP